MRSTLHPKLGSRSGVSVVDMAIAATILVVVLGSFTQTVTSVSSQTNVERLESMLASTGNQALRRIVDDIRYSGYVTEGGVDFPALYENGDAPPGFDEHDHDPPLVVAQEFHAEPAAAGLADDIAREIVFLLPSDADGDEVPDLDADGEILWSAEEFSYVLLPDGVSNRIERRIDGVLDATIARNVESLHFDTPLSSGFAVPLGCLRIRIALSGFDDDGRRGVYAIETTIRLRNGGV